MKAVCRVCERVFELCPVAAEEGSGIAPGGMGFSLLPEHDAVPGKGTSEVRDGETGKVLKVICDGSLRPPQVAVH